MQEIPCIFLSIPPNLPIDQCNSTVSHPTFPSGHCIFYAVMVWISYLTLSRGITVQYPTSHSPTGKGSCLISENTSDSWGIPRYVTRKRCVTSIYTFWILTVFWQLLLENAACFISVYIFKIQRTRTLWFCLGEVRLAYQPLFSELSPRSPFPSPLPPLLPPGVGTLPDPREWWKVDLRRSDRTGSYKSIVLCGCYRDLVSVLLCWVSVSSSTQKMAFIYLRFRCGF